VRGEREEGRKNSNLIQEEIGNTKAAERKQYKYKDRKEGRKTKEERIPIQKEINTKICKHKLTINKINKYIIHK